MFLQVPRFSRGTSAAGTNSVLLYHGETMNLLPVALVITQRGHLGWASLAIELIQFGPCWIACRTVMCADLLLWNSFSIETFMFCCLL